MKPFISTTFYGILNYIISFTLIASPWLFGFAAEHGAVTQSVENNKLIFRGNVANAISAIKFHDYITSFNKIQEQNYLVRTIAKNVLRSYF